MKVSVNPFNLFRLTVIFLVGITCIMGQAHAADTVVVLPIESDQLNDLAREVTTRLEQQIDGQPGFKNRGQVNFSLDEAKETFDCASEAPKCMAAAGKMFKTPVLFWGSLEKGRGLTLKLRGLRIASVSMDYRLDVTFEDRRQLRAELDKVISHFLARKPYRRALSVRIKTRPPGASITMDGRRIGVSPVTVRIQPGVHKVRLQLEGYTELEETINLSDTDDALRFSLRPLEAVPVPVTETIEPPPVRRKWPLWLGIATGTAALAATGTAIYFGNATVKKSDIIKAEGAKYDKEAKALAADYEAALGPNDEPTARSREIEQELDILNARHFPQEGRNQRQHDDAQLKTNIAWAVAAVTAAVSVYSFVVYSKDTTISVGPGSVGVRVEY